MARPPLTLAIEISNPSAAEEGDSPARPGVAIGEGTSINDARVLGTETMAGGRAHDDDLLPAIDRLTRRLSIGPRDLARVAVSTGPGGFTSLRLAVAAAKMICEATGAACRGVPTANVAARALGPATARFAVALASKYDSVFLTVFDNDGVAEGPGRVVISSDMPSLNIRTLVADAYLPAEIAQACQECGIDIRPLTLDAASCFFASLAEPDIDPLLLGPLYPRPPEAVLKWRALHPERYPAG